MQEQEDFKQLDMRYEEAELRSKRKNPSWIDRAWTFFSSVKVGLWLIALIIIASGVGTIFPQEMYIPQATPPEEFYQKEYGTAGDIYYTLGFHNLFESWWYIGLITLLLLSIIIVSIDRFFPLYRALKKQPVIQSDRFMNGQRFGAEATGDVKKIDAIAPLLENKGYKIRRQDGALLAEKQRFGRWGPYINHIGLVLFFGGAMLRVVPGMHEDELLWLREGETLPIEATDNQYYLKNEAFNIEFYDPEKVDAKFKKSLEAAGGNVPKNYDTKMTLYKKVGETSDFKPELEEIKSGETAVNRPFEFDDYQVFQEQYAADPEFKTMSFNIVNQKTDKVVDTIKVDLRDPKETYALKDGYEVELKDFLPDFVVKDGQPTTNSGRPVNPAFVFSIKSPEHPKGERSLIGIKLNVGGDENQYKMAFAGTELSNISGVRIKKDLTLPFLFAGGIIFMAGLLIGMYWPHRRLWLKEKNGRIQIAGFTNKNALGLQKEANLALTEVGLPELEDRQKLREEGEAK